MNSTIDRIQALEKLGQIIANGIKTNQSTTNSFEAKIARLIQNQYLKNPWFTPENVEFALSEIATGLQRSNLTQWLCKYSIEATKSKNVGVVLAGNLPAVGFHDFLCVLMSGHNFVGKMSHDDQNILPLLGEILVAIEPAFESRIRFTDGQLKGIDAVIATGSNNSARYFEYYFGKYPHIIRKNRNGVAVLTGAETKNDIQGIGEDVFRYYGMGCRSVSKLFVPNGYDFQYFLDQLNVFKTIGDHHKYMNNYDYYKSIYLINQEKHLDTGFLLLKEQAGYSSPPAVLFYEYYNDIQMLNSQLKTDSNLIQCVVSNSDQLDMENTAAGNSQRPKLWDYADGVDTMEFLIKL